MTATSEAVPAGHVTPGQLAYWRRTGLLRPGRGELTQARAIAALRRAGMSLRHIRAAAERLCLLSGSDPAPGGAPPAEPSQLRFAVHGQELFVQRDGGAWESDRAPGQLILDGVVPLVPIDGVAVGPLPGGVPPGEPGPAGTRGRPPGQVRRGRPATPSARDEIRLFLTRQRDLDRRGRSDARQSEVHQSEVHQSDVHQDEAGWSLRCGEFMIGGRLPRPVDGESRLPGPCTAFSTSNTEHPGRPLHRN